jgi:hypothetical protein
MPQACLDLAMAHETAEVPRRFLAVSNEYIVFVSTTITYVRCYLPLNFIKIPG